MAIFKLLRRFQEGIRQNNEEDLQDISIKDFWHKHGLEDDSMDANVSDVEVTSPDDVLPPESLTSTEHDDVLKRRELEHRLKLRRLILSRLVVPMAIIPIWLMVLLTVPVFDKNSGVSDTMQMAYLTAVVSDFAGLYWIITRDLFPDGKREKKQKTKR